MKANITSIQVFGSNCPTCQKLYELTKEAAQQLNIAVAVEYSTDIQKLLDTGMMSSPVLVINGRPVLAGRVSSLENIKELLSADNQPPEAGHGYGGACCCGGHC